MISSPITSMLSRGQVLQNPREVQPGVENRCRWSTASGRVTVTPSEPSSETNPSSSSWAGSISRRGYL